METENKNVKLNFSDGTLKASVLGEIDHHFAKGIRDTIDSALSAYRPNALILDLSGITFMDSSGLGLVLGRYNKACSLCVDFSVIGADERTVRMFDMAGLDRMIDYKSKEKERT